MKTLIQLTTYDEGYARAIADMFHGAVHQIPDEIYPPEQKSAWAPEPLDYEKWKFRLSKTLPAVALIDQQVAGFMELTDTGYIDCCYVHPNHQGKGVFSALFNHALEKTAAIGLTALTVDASLVAQPIFQHYGFETVRENSIKRGEETLINYSMVKLL